MAKRRVLGMLVLVALLAAGLGAAVPTAAEGPLAGIKVCIDPGHGGDDPGAVNGDLYESHINLDVSYGLKALLEGQGATVVMTRYADDYRDNRDRYTFCNTEAATILVSVHTNSSTNPKMDGSMGLYFHADDKLLAQAIHAVMYPALQSNAPDPAAFTDFGLSRFASGVLLKSDMPAAMMEPLLMSHPGEAALLLDTIYTSPGSGEFSAGCTDFMCRRGEIAQALYEGVLAYLGDPEPPPPPPPGGTMHVGAIDMGSQQKGPNVFVDTAVTIHDAEGSPVSAAWVWVSTTLPDGLSEAFSGQTGEDGTVTFSLRSRQTGTYTSTVTNVSKEGWDYDVNANVETSETLDVP
jgi:hypothetical protein